jgi:hypothetical protein
LHPTADETDETSSVAEEDFDLPSDETSDETQDVHQEPSENTEDRKVSSVSSVVDDETDAANEMADSQTGNEGVRESPGGFVGHPGGDAAGYYEGEI